MAVQSTRSTTPEKGAPNPVVSPDTQPENTSGQSVEETKVPDGFAGSYGFDLEGDGPAKTSAKDLLRDAQVLAPSLTAEFVKAYGLSDDVLREIASGMVPPPPAIGPNHTVDLYLTPGGWQITKPGVVPGASDAISR
jgi:hypothetical protein